MLTKIGMEKGRQYETVISTKNTDNTRNAAPIGVIYSGSNTIVNRIFKGSRTLDNIIAQKEFVVNITDDAEVFALSTIGNLPQNYFNKNGSIRGADAYFKCEVVSLKEAVKQSDPIKKNGEAIVIKSEVVELTVNKPVKAFNRGFAYVVESLANLSRFDIADSRQKEHYLNEFRNANRVVTKVGYKDDIAAMKMIKNELMKKGLKP